MSAIDATPKDDKGLSIARLDCTAKRFEEPAAVVAENFPRLKEAKAKFATARTRYQDARDKAAPVVEEARRKLGQSEKGAVPNDTALEACRCRLKDEERKRVEGALASASSDPVSPARHPAFEGIKKDESLDALAARIITYRSWIADDEARFTALLEEIDQTAVRAAEVKAEVDAIDTMIKTAAEGTDWVRLYARALIAEWKLEAPRIWGNNKNVNQLVDALEDALSLATEGWAKVAMLEGVRAEKECQLAADKTALDNKRAELLGEVMKEYAIADETPPTGAKATEAELGQAEAT